MPLSSTAQRPAAPLPVTMTALILAATGALLILPLVADASWWIGYSLPRFASGAIAGACFALGGHCYQRALRNPLAGPGILGVTAFAQIALMITVTFFPGATAEPLFAAFAAGCLALAVVMLVAGGLRAAPATIALAGVVTALSAGAGIAVLTILRGEDIAGLLFWGAGTPEQLDWRLIRAMLPPAALCLALGLGFPSLFSLLKLDDDSIASLGASPTRLRLLALTLGTLAVACGVVLAGPISFLGLIIPNLVRLSGLPSERGALLLSALLGGLLLIAADLAALALEAQGLRITAGTLVALLGAPVCILLIRRMRLQAAPPNTAQMASTPSPFLRRAFVFTLAPLIAVLAWLSLAWGSVPIALGDIVNWLTGINGDNARLGFILDLRGTRTLAALGGGALLALSGYLLQTISRNPIAGPEVLGLTNGAALGAVLAGLLIGETQSVLLLGSFLGGSVVFLAILLIAGRGASPMRLLITGLIAGGACSGITAVITLSADMRLVQIVTWLSGTLYQTTGTETILLGTAAVVLLAIMLCAARALPLLQLQDENLLSLGFKPGLLRLVLLALAVLAVAIVVSAVGAISFIGLVAPAVVRRLKFSSPVTALLAACISGGCLLLAADLAGRLLLAPTQLPAGAITALIGAPFFLFLLRSGKYKTS